MKLIHSKINRIKANLKYIKLTKAEALLEPKEANPEEEAILVGRLNGIETGGDSFVLASRKLFLILTESKFKFCFVPES